MTFVIQPGAFVRIFSNGRKSTTYVPRNRGTIYKWTLKAKCDTCHPAGSSKVKALKFFDLFLRGIPFTIITYWASLKLTLAKKQVNSLIERWALQFENYDYKIVHRSGKLLPHVDALSLVTRFTPSSHRILRCWAIINSISSCPFCGLSWTTISLVMVTDRNSFAQSFTAMVVIET